MIIIRPKEHSQCDISGMDVTFRQEPQRSGTQNATLPDGSLPPSIKSLTRKRDSRSEMGNQIGTAERLSRQRPGKRARSARPWRSFT